MSDERTPLIENVSKKSSSLSSLNYSSNEKNENSATKKYFSSTNILKNKEESSFNTSLPNVNQNSATISEDHYSLHDSKYNIGSENFDHITLTWSNVNVTIADEATNCCKSLIRRVQGVKSGGRKHILKNVSGIAYPGRLMALMGTSGAGKTTLLNVLNQRNFGKLNVDSNVQVNGVNIGKLIRSISAYVQQDDLFFSTFKVKEHLQFQANLRLGRNITQKQRDDRVKQVIIDVVLGLSDCADTYLKKISGGERKRLAFASEVLTNPCLMFCDEPTSGLDSFMAEQVVSVLKTLAKRGKTIVCTIHQPSSQVFEYFDDLCLLAEGRVAFMGTLREAVEFFKRVNFPCPHKFNPADHYIRILAIVPGEEQERKNRIKDICRVYRETSVAESVQIKIRSAEESNSYENSEEMLNYKANWFRQFSSLYYRAMMQCIREPLLVQVRIWQAIVISIISGLIYFQTDINSKTIQNVNGILFTLIMNMSMSYVFSVVHVFCEEMPIFMREHFSHIYRVDAYYLAKNISELPQYIILPAIFTVIFYFMAGLSPEPSVFFVCLGVNILTANVGISIGYAISTAFMNINLAMSIVPILVIPFMLVAVFMILLRSIPVFFIWLKYLSYIRYSYEALAVNEWQTVTYIPGCEDFTCPINGTGVLKTLHFDPANLKLDVTALFVMFFVIRFIGFLALLIRSYKETD